nr:immunoglobulin heavy chain junction region [Macaca mulatta]
CTKVEGRIAFGLNRFAVW